MTVDYYCQNVLQYRMQRLLHPDGSFYWDLGQPEEDPRIKEFRQQLYWGVKRIPL